jgi:hypothetical protein
VALSVLTYVVSFLVDVVYPYHFAMHSMHPYTAPAAVHSVAAAVDAVAVAQQFASNHDD